MESYNYCNGWLLLLRHISHFFVTCQQSRGQTQLSLSKAECTFITTFENKTNISCKTPIYNFFQDIKLLFKRYIWPCVYNILYDVLCDLFHKKSTFMTSNEVRQLYLKFYLKTFIFPTS